jgi:vacuolar-type H+-ATPase subunit H
MRMKVERRRIMKIEIEDVIKELVSSEKESRNIVQEAKQKSEEMIKEAEKKGKELVESKVDEANEMARKMLKDSEEKMRINDEKILSETRNKVMKMREAYLNAKDEIIETFISNFLEVEK